MADDRGVSVIVGALLLILITVIAAAALAMITSEAIKQQDERQTLQRAVSNEDLQITSIRPDYLDNNITISVQNLNTADSTVNAISLNTGGGDMYYKNFTVNNIAYNYTSPLTIPAGSMESISLDNLDMYNRITPSTSDFLTVSLMTGYANTFRKSQKPPVPVIRSSVQSETIGNVQRDYILLDASDSTSDNATIVSYQWTVAQYPFWVNPVYYNGRTVRVNPTTNDSLEICLTVTDQNNMTASTMNTPIILPADDNYIPPSNIIVVNNAINSSFNVTVLDTNMNPAPWVVVKFIRTAGNVILDTWAARTNLLGQANVTIVNGSGSVQISAGQAQQDAAWP